MGESQCPETKSSLLDQPLTDPMTENDTPIPFKHEPLNLAQRSAVRILRVLSELSPQGRIQCLLMNGSTRFPYTCLSYRWGSSAHGHLIEVNGKTLEVRTNLWNFLDMARTRYDYIPLWIDAICLDQSNIAERNHQVRQMGHIYNAAVEVLVWLGIGEPAHAHALECLEHDSFFMNILESRDVAKVDPQTAASIYCFQESLTQLCEDEYWGRVWIVQEILLAKQLQVVYGYTQISWEKFSSFACLGADGPLLSIHPKSQQQLRDRLRNSRARVVCKERGNVFNVFRRQVGYDLQTILRQFGTWQCEDPRDHVLGLIGLTRLGPNAHLIDYSMDALTLFNHLAKFCLADSVLETRKLLDPFGLSARDVWTSSLDVSIRVPQTQIDISSAAFRSLGCSTCGVEKLRLVEKSIPALLRGQRNSLANLRGSEAMVCLAKEGIQDHLLFYRAEPRTGYFVGLATSTGETEGAMVKATLLQNSTLRESSAKRHLDVDAFGYSYILSAGQVRQEFEMEQAALRETLASGAWSSKTSLSPVSVLETDSRTERTREWWLEKLLGKPKTWELDAMSSSRREVQVTSEHLDWAGMRLARELLRIARAGWPE